MDAVFQTVQTEYKLAGRQLDYVDVKVIVILQLSIVACGIIIQ